MHPGQDSPRFSEELLAAWAEARGSRTSKVRLGAVVVASAIAAVFAAVWIVRTARPLVTVPAPAPVAERGPGDLRFGVPEAVRKEIFREIAAAEPDARAQGAAGFPGEPWSQEDHRCAFERDTVRSIAGRRALNLAQVYLILDEGIREGWPGPDGKPLLPTTVPLVPRRK